MAASDALGRQFPDFTPRHAGAYVIDMVAKGNAGGTSREQAQGRLLTSRPWPKPIVEGGAAGMYGLMEKLAPGAVPLKQRTRKLN